MNKKIIVFICILSFIVPFLPSFNIVVSASSVSDNNTPEQIEFMVSLGFHWNEDLNLWVPDNSSSVTNAIEYVLADQGFVVDNPVTIVTDFILGVAGVDWGHAGYTSSDVSQIQQAGVTSQNIINYSITYANDNVPYYVYRSMPVSEFFSYFVFNPTIPASELQTFRNWLVSVVNNNVDQLCGFYCFSFLNDNTNFLVDYSDLMDEYTLALYQGQFYNYPDLPFQSYEHTAVTTDQPYPYNNLLKFYSNDLGSIYDGNFNYWTPSSYGIAQVGTDSHSCIGFVLNRFYPSNYHNCNGTLYLSPDSVGSISFPVFRSGTDLQLFYKGRSDVYRFDSSIDLGQYGDQIDYSKLYDIVSSSIRGSSGNVIDAINNAVDNYLQEQIDLLHDINNALNDGNGQSWLRRIYDILDYNFPLTLMALQDLKYAIENISLTGGSADLSYTNHVLDQINDKLGFLIDQPVLDGTPQDFEELRTLAQNKFPFCVFSDIVALTVILNQSPEEPHWQVPLKLPCSASSNIVEVDLSWYEYIRDYVHAIFIFMFIIGLLVLSVKIFDAVKS